jgi:hypothetical protein
MAFLVKLIKKISETRYQLIFGALTFLMLVITIIFVVYNFIFLVSNFNKVFTNIQPPAKEITFDIAAFEKLNLIKR